MPPPRRPRDETRMITTVQTSPNVNWSINIPELADLVLRFGAEGLKRLQLSGVDIHTIGCILSLGEITPASLEYRTRLQKAREVQRAKTWWIHNTIQYGSGVNFVVDELLKTRAGENVLALMTATSSVLEGNDLEVFNLLYNKYDPGMQNTPSVAQLDRLRSICLPLARAMDFKDRLAEIHSWLVTTMKGVSHVNFDSAIPSAETLAQLVEILKDICIQDGQQRSRLAFYGLDGAAWLINYAKGILGLSVCMVLKNGETIPLSGDFKTASVLVYPQATETTEVFKSISKAGDIIHLTNEGARTLSTNWLLSCDVNGVDFFALMCRWDMRNRQEIGNLIFSIAAEYVERSVGYGQYRCLTHYHAQDLESKLDTLRVVLHLLGLPDQVSRQNNWRESSFKNLLVDGLQQIELSLQQFSTMLHRPNETHADCTHDMIQPREVTTAFSICVRCHLHDIVREISFLACILVFSDWHLSLRRVSHRRILTGGDRLSQDAFGFFLHVYSDHGLERVQGSLYNEYTFLLEPNPLAKHLAAICSGSSHSEDLIQSNNHKLLGIDIDGVLMIRYVVIDQSLRSGPVFILREGEFSLHGEQRPLLITSLQHGSSSFNCEIHNARELKPFNHFPHAELILKASLQRDAIKLQYTFSFESEDEVGELMSLEIDVPVIELSSGLCNLYRTPACPHGYRNPIQVMQVRPQTSKKQGLWQDEYDHLWQIRDKLTFGMEDPNMSTSTSHLCINHLFPVDGNPIAGWAAVALSWHRSKFWRPAQAVLLLQQKACLSCTLAYAEELSIDGSGERQDLFIFSSGEV
jgi:hypothetical protein